MIAVAKKDGGGFLRGMARAAQRPAAHGQQFPRWLASFASPPERWSGTHRLLAHVALAATAFTLGAHGWRAAGVGATAGSRAELADLERRVEEARAALERLPAMKKAASHSDASRDAASRSPTAMWQAISSLAERSGMMVSALEPGAVGSDRIRASRAVRVAAKGEFAALLAFVRALSELPALAVPVALQLEPAEDGLAIDATLQVYDALPGDSLADDATIAEAVKADGGLDLFVDPFAAAPGVHAGTRATEIRLVGFIHEQARAHGLALLATDDGVAIYWPGQTIGTEQVVSIDARGVTLASGEQRRVMKLEKETIS
ncbi:hypothetical protein B0G57_113126 [Trinickia symbiotica]|uniref:Pilus assembly protein n=1 Tax=Trinickia symbiotica TaxID=863227 RepID=A0A2N7WZC2_9BURK|nr:hypothetical protein [Trinickia symbiotica]PMS34671.1 hypothetical protein C0Z20_21750 [Trinickia symbiotica]PPK43368.1 hypothetical protein B0G57_113126 [Trinickia symbiotica]